MKDFGLNLTIELNNHPFIFNSDQWGVGGGGALLLWVVKVRPLPLLTFRGYLYNNHIIITHPHPPHRLYH